MIFAVDRTSKVV